MEVAGGLVTVEAMAMVVNDENGKCLLFVGWYSRFHSVHVEGKCGGCLISHP